MMVDVKIQPFLDQLKDVTITSPVDNEILSFDNSSGLWINQTPSEAGLDSIYLKLDGSNANTTINIGSENLTTTGDVSATTLTSPTVADHPHQDVNTTATPTFDGLTSTSQIALNKVGANIITASNANGDLRLGAGGGTNDLQIDINGNVEIFENLDVGGNVKINNPSTTALLVEDDGTNDNVFVVDTTFSGGVGINSPGSFQTGLFINKESPFNNFGGTGIVTLTDVTVNHTSTGIMQSFGIQNEVDVSGNISGSNPSDRIRGTTTLVNFSGNVNSATAVIDLDGSNIETKFTGTITNANTIRVTGENIKVGGNLGTAATTYHRGVDINVSGSADNNLGIFIENVTGATNNYAIQTGTGLVSFGDDVQLNSNDILGGATGNFTSIDLGTNTITDGVMTGSWVVNSAVEPMWRINDTGASNNNREWLQIYNKDSAKMMEFGSNATGGPEIRFGDPENTKVGFPDSDPTYFAFINDSTEMWLGNALDPNLYYNFYVGSGVIWGTALNLQTGSFFGTLRIGDGGTTNYTEINSTGDIKQVGIGRTHESEKFKLTALGGYAIKLTNKTGSNSVAGQLVQTDTSTNDAVKLTSVDEEETIGVFLDAGISDGSEAWVVVIGIADVAMQDNTTATRGNWVRSSATEAGYADATNAEPPSPAAFSHFNEIGNCIETVTATGGGTHVLARCVLHFN